MYEPLAILAAFALVYSAFSAAVERTWISGPILFLAFGLLVGPLGLGLLSPEDEAETLKTLAELTLALILFTDAAGSNLGVLRRAGGLPLRLLGLGLPLTIALGFGLGLLLFGELHVLEVALLATMLAPTDAALGQAVVQNEAVPGPVRVGLNVESGLNDGICVPILFLFLALMGGLGAEETAWGVGLKLFAEEVGIGLAVGLPLTVAAVWMVRLSQRRGWQSPAWHHVSVGALAFTCFGAAQHFGGSGFIACFAGGLLFGGLVTKSKKEDLLGAAEGVGATFSMLTWVLFAVAAVSAARSAFEWQVVLYSLASLTVVRMLPVFVSLAGSGASTEEKLFIGWFGPRGLASLVFAVIVIGADLPNGRLLTMVVICTVTLSILLHGVTASPWASAFGARARGSGPGGGDSADDPSVHIS